MSGRLFSGDLYFRRKLNGVFGPLLPFGNATKMALKENAEIKKRKSKQKADYGQILDAVGIKGEAEISLELDDLDKDSIALLFLGTASDINESGAAVTGEPYIAHLDTLIKLDHRNISAVVIGALVENTDFEIVNEKVGIIKILSGGSVSEDDPLSVNYTYSALTGSKVTGGTNASIKVQLFLDGYDLVSQKDAEVNVWEAELTPDSEMDFLADDFATLGLSGTMIKPANKPSAYEANLDLS